MSATSRLCGCGGATLCRDYLKARKDSAARRVPWAEARSPVRREVQRQAGSPRAALRSVRDILSAKAFLPREKHQTRRG